ncbi:MAG TPA: response regulator [Bryobacteraceae bacterium]|jgi:DNA-binding response OmpR family regulator|nr:response regulator [Bryobacteraceae bacterium]
MTSDPILIIDDTPVNLRLTKILLVNEGYQVLTAASAEEGLEVLRDHHPQLILVDIQLPGIDGLEFTRLVRQDVRMLDVSIVALTAFAMKGDEQKALDAGCDGYITKPIDTRALGARVREHLRRRNGAQEALQSNESAAATGSGVPDDEMAALQRQFLTEGQVKSRQLLSDLDATFDAAEAARAVHQWVGTGGLLGYTNIARASREVEALLRERPLDNSQLRDALINLTLGFASPKESREIKLPDSVTQGLDGKKIAGVGLPANEKERLCMALDRVHAEAVFFESTATPDRAMVEQCDAGVVHVWAFSPDSPWLNTVDPVFGNRPLVLVGSRDDVLTLDPEVQAMAREFLMDAWQPEEALVRLSMALSARPAASAPKPAEKPKLNGHMDIVVADDDPIVLALVRTTLQNFGMSCHVVGSGPEALAKIREVHPQAAVLDVNMPGMDGYEVLAAIRQEQHSTRVLMLTARQQENDILRGFTLGADDYVIKPFSPIELAARLKRLLGK